MVLAYPTSPSWAFPPWTWAAWHAACGPFLYAGSREFDRQAIRAAAHWLCREGWAQRLVVICLSDSTGRCAS
jgi:hypothetical protein